ncbi:hypothetical protein P4464_002317 [Salmonella enterica]|nr:hypothetical protein [Salmonella enterica subsp. enterica serovar Newport]EEH4116374.1 hypothetical protein [Salmonella enterica subsp. enterica serovar Hvittingfoss]EKQ3557780.1 hypothetical protein [Salmonella enterica]HAU3138140.1 hypothetical protein [Salmonella enterica subsp. diarizonae]
MEIHSKATDRGRIIALQVGFAALVEFLSKENPFVGEKITKYLEDTGMDPENKDSSAAFYELAEIIIGLKELREQRLRDSDN